MSSTCPNARQHSFLDHIEVLTFQHQAVPPVPTKRSEMIDNNMERRTLITACFRTSSSHSESYIVLVNPTRQMASPSLRLSVVFWGALDRVARWRSGVDLR